MAKSLTETAKSILMKEGAVPSVSPMDAGHPDRGATSKTPNMGTLRPGSAGPEGRFANPGSNAPGGAEAAEDLGPALVNNTDIPPSAKASGKMKKDSSKSAQAAVAAEPKKSLAEIYQKIKEEKEAKEKAEQAKLAETASEETEETIEEEIEMSEELTEFVEKMIAEGHSEEEIAAAVAENFEVVEEEVEASDDTETVAEEATEEPIEETMETEPTVSMKEHVDALLEGEELSEEFRVKAETIFESALQSKLKEEVALIEAAYAESLQEETTKIMDQMTEQVDGYLNYVVEQWIAQNEVAIESGLRTELVESFIEGFRGLCAEHYLDIPEEKVPVVESLAEKVQSLEEKLNEEIAKNVELNKVLAESKKSEILNQVCETLTDTQAAKLKTLAEDLNFTTTEEFERKVETLKESYFPVSVKSQETLDNIDTDGKTFIKEGLQGPMDAYVRVLGKSLPK